ncbi:MAG: N-acetylmuramoyl-L-alanine amidase [Anaerovibrio sp.]|uniref:N-acetylmuramoyl-L-alanine amidase family protein n=1 Tax=Anaerovibrio sp. TaxID=1872532 RepID=UPI0025D2A1A0|nr:N-acetylmuramoyl-L-alanine amidase [Anaerovibrio sp.]MCR5175701.1 N-acetylmuramoyl-L-alanine amidase [Anaerovibrio sp.]
MKVFINPGHAPNGNPDPGALNEYLGLRECDIALSIGDLVRRYLVKAVCKVKELQSHNLAGESAGECIVQSANDWQADIFVSIHCNAANTLARGAETLVYSLTGEGAALGRFIQNQLCSTLQKFNNDFPDRGLKCRPLLAVLRGTTMPAVLVETAFIDNDLDALLLMNQQQDIAGAIARGITDYWQKNSREE